MQKFLTPEDTEAPKLDEVLMTASYGSSFCYALAKDVYCVGYFYDYRTLKHISVPQGVKRLSVGYYSLAIEDMNNNWRFIDIENNLPKLIINQISYNFGEELLDLKLFRDIICYLNSEQNLYCGGYGLRDFINPRYYENFDFLKMTDIKIKEFSIAKFSITAIGLDGKIYYWMASDVYDNNLKNYSVPLDVRSIIYELLFDKEVKKINTYKSVILVTTKDYKIYVYSSSIFQTIGGLEFGENLNQGQEISEGLKFTELGILEEALCGLTAEKELYCRGLSPYGLKYESNINKARQFTKVSNAPKNIKQVLFGFESICFILDSNEITCAGQITGKKSIFTDFQGRLIYTGNENKSMFQAPHIIEPIRN